jgi:hypothetical protein
MKIYLTVCLLFDAAGLPLLASAAGDSERFSATIPAASFTAGDMVRWRVQVR